MTPHVLVVDDQEGMRATLSDILAGAGYDVTTAEDGDTALREVRGGRYDVVVMDIRMPGRDGVSVLRQIGSPPPRVIMMTAYAVEDQIRAAVNAKAFAVVHKPFRVDALLELVADAAGQE